MILTDFPKCMLASGAAEIFRLQEKRVYDKWNGNEDKRPQNNVQDDMLVAF